MRIINKIINGCSHAILDVVIMDDADVADISESDRLLTAIRIDLSSLEYLHIFPCIKTLVLTSGMPTRKGKEALYAHRELENLVLDYEETDSDEEGVNTSFFPQLRYLLTRSNLNVYHLSGVSPTIKCEIVNEYGKRRKVRIAPNSDLLHDSGLFFFSAEASSPAGPMLMKILVEIERKLNALNTKRPFSENLDSIGIVPICLVRNLVESGFGKQRKFVSLKKRYADIRLCIPYDTFVHASEEERRRLCKQNILDALIYISEKDDSLNIERVISAVNSVF